MIKQKLHKYVALALFFIFAFPLVFQPAHYFFIHHDNHSYVHYQKSQIVEKHKHIVCAIDHFQLTELVSFFLSEYTCKLNINAIINYVYKSPFVRTTVFLLFLLRAPPF